MSLNPAMPELTPDLVKILRKFDLLRETLRVMMQEPALTSDVNLVDQLAAEGMAQGINLLLQAGLVDMKKLEEMQ